MGWTYRCYPERREEFVRRRVNQNWGQGRELLAWEDTKTALWFAVMRGPNEPNAGKPFLAMEFIDRNDEGCWGYKEASEGMYPNEFSCPLSMFEVVPFDPSDPWHCGEWREAVMAAHARRKPSVIAAEKAMSDAIAALEIEPGAKLLINGEVCKLGQKLPRQRWAVLNANGDQLGWLWHADVVMVRQRYLNAILAQASRAQADLAYENGQGKSEMAAL